jgi:hypothetical protein
MVVAVNGDVIADVKGLQRIVLIKPYPAETPA